MEQATDRKKIFIAVSRAIQRCLNSSNPIKETDRLVEDLQFDSLRIATLTFCIEEELNCSIALNEWVVGANDSSELTVASLVNFIAERKTPAETA